MATYTKVCSNNSNYTLRLELSESNVNIVSNTSVINYSLYLDSSYTRFEDWDVTYTLYLGSAVSINNTSRMSMPPTRGEPLLLTSGSRTVTHYDDGSMSLSISCSVSTSTSQFYLPGSATISGQSFTMTTIARKSTLYNINQHIGYTFNLEVTRYSNSFTHTISYVFGGLSGVIVAKSSQLKIPWTPPLEAYLQIAGKQDGQGTITIETFSGNTSLGTNSYTLRLVATEIYNPPAVEGLRYERGSGNSDSTWVSDPTGSNIKVSYKVAFTSGIDGNTTKLSVKLDSSVKVSETLTANGVKVHYIQNIGTTTTHRLYINLFDTIGSNRVWTLTVSTIEVPFDINVNLPGIACGKVAETEKAFELAEDWTLKVKGKSLLDFFYPVKSVYITFDNTFNPNEHFGGTWERIRNRFLWAATENGVMGETGGEAEHTLTASEMPSHNGHLSAGIAGTAPYGKGNYKGFLNSNVMTAYGDGGRGWNVYAGNEMHPASEAVGGGQPHNNMPPFIQVAMWKRIA